jgi:hypothetical protein
MKLVLAFVTFWSIAGIAMARDAQPVWSCPTVETTRSVNECRARCRDTNDAKNASCNDAYKQCAFSCKGDGLHECRQRCHDSYDACRNPLVQEYNSCLDGCVTSAGCSL